MLDLSIEGLAEPIGVTANHPIWSEDRQEFVQAGSLQLRQADGSLTQVASLLPRESQEPVYNLEVEGEHVYYVSSSGLLVHNSCATSKNARALRKYMGAAAFDVGDEAHHIVASTHKMAEDGRKILKRYHIDINDAVNGVALPHNKHHGKGLHSHLEIQEVVDTLRAAQRKGGTYKQKKKWIKEALSDMAELMKAGKFLEP